MAAKLEWGAKRTCLSCAARFYDMRREPITCPKCNTVFDPEAAFRPRRARSTDGGAAARAASKKKKPTPVEVVEKTDADPEAAPEKETPEDAVIEDDDSDSDDLIEDTSDLGEDDDGLPAAPDPDNEDDK